MKHSITDILGTAIAAIFAWPWVHIIGVIAVVISILANSKAAIDNIKGMFRGDI